MTELVDWAAQLDLADELGRPAIADPRIKAVERIFSRILLVAFFTGNTSVTAWIVLNSRRIWAEAGPSAGLAAIISSIGELAIAQLGDYRLGYVIASHMLAVSQERGFEPEISVLRHRPAGCPVERTGGERHRPGSGGSRRFATTQAYQPDLTDSRDRTGSPT